MQTNCNFQNGPSANLGKQYELQTAINVNRWIAKIGRQDELLAVMTLGRNNHSDIAVVRIEDSIPFPDFSNPFASDKVRKEDYQRLQRSLDLAATNLENAIAYIEVKLGERVQMGTPRCNFISGRWDFNRPPRICGRNFLLEKLNSEECLTQTSDFASQFPDKRNLVCYSNKAHALSAISYKDLKEKAGNLSKTAQKYIIKTKDEDPNDIARMIANYYLAVKGSMTNYMQIKGRGLFRLSENDPLGLSPPMFLDSILPDAKRTGFGMRYIMRSRGVYEIIPELKFKCGTFKKSDFDFDNFI